MGVTAGPIGDCDAATLVFTCGDRAFRAMLNERRIGGGRMQGTKDVVRAGNALQARQGRKKGPSQDASRTAAIGSVWGRRRVCVWIGGCV